jgi:hypothetical protein
MKLLNSALKFVNFRTKLINSVVKFINFEATILDCELKLIHFEVKFVHIRAEFLDFGMKFFTFDPRLSRRNALRLRTYALYCGGVIETNFTRGGGSQLRHVAPICTLCEDCLARLAFGC